MTISDLVTKLQRLGYQLSQAGPNLQFRYTGKGEPPGGAVTLLEQVRKHKGEVIAYLQLLAATGKIEDCLREVSINYQPRLLAWIRTEHRDQWRQLLDIEDTINQATLSGNGDGLAQALGAYRAFSKEMLEAYRKARR